jgi:hypothetical protein
MAAATSAGPRPRDSRYPVQMRVDDIGAGPLMTGRWASCSLSAAPAVGLSPVMVPPAPGVGGTRHAPSTPTARARSTGRPWASSRSTRARPVLVRLADPRQKSLIVLADRCRPLGIAHLLLAQPLRPYASDSITCSVAVRCADRSPAPKCSTGRASRSWSHPSPRTDTRSSHGLRWRFVSQSPRRHRC